MLEIILIIVLSKRIAAIVSEKGRSPIGYVVMFIFFWLAAEFAAAMLVAIGWLIMHPNKEQPLLVLWLAGLLGAACGGGLAFIIAYRLPAVEDHRSNQQDFDIHGYPRKSRRSSRKRSLPEDEPYWDRRDEDHIQSE